MVPLMMLACLVQAPETLDVTAVNDAHAPALVVNELSYRARGSLGLWVGDGSAGIFANLRVMRKP